MQKFWRNLFLFLMIMLLFANLIAAIMDPAVVTSIIAYIGSWWASFMIIGNVEETDGPY